jgi:hypothetical protein
MNFPALFSIFSAMIAIGFLGVALFAGLATKRQTTWARVPGRVIRSRVNFDGEDFAADVLYSYRHNGVTYTGKTVSFPQFTHNWRGPAERVCTRYPEGTEVIVYVNPEYPRSAVLEPPSRIGAIVFLLISIVLLILAWGLR